MTKLIEVEFCSQPCPYTRIFGEMYWCWHPNGKSEIVLLPGNTPPNWCPLEDKS